MATAVSFDGISIQTTNIHISSLEHESMDHREINIQRLGNRDGGKFIADVFAPRTIRISGTIQGTDKADLEDRIDDLKQLFNKREKNLDVGYVSGTRRYKASCSKLTISRKYYNITFTEFDAEFICSDPPFGTSVDTSTIEYSPINYTIGTWYTNANFVGTYKPMPIIQVTVNSETSLEQIAFTNRSTGQQIKVPYSFTAGDVLRIDTSEYTVAVNGTAVDYEGVFPEFVQGGNDFKVSFISLNHNVTMKLIYYELYL